MKAAHMAMNKLADEKDVVVELPNVENMDDLVAELGGVGISGHPHKPKVLDPKAVRQHMKLSQKDFALRFGLDVATIRNWEQNRSGLTTTARALLQTIAHDPDAVSAAMENDGRVRRAKRFMQNSKRFRTLKEAKLVAKKQVATKAAKAEKELPSARKGRGEGKY